MNKKTLIKDINGLHEYVSEHRRMILSRDGICDHCMWHSKCAESVSWNVRNHLRKMTDSSYRAQLEEFLERSSCEEIWQRFVSDYLPCDHTAAEMILEWDALESAYNSLTDEESKEVFIEMLMYRLTWDDAYTCNADRGGDQYFIDCYTGLCSDESVVDCGAYTADTLETYLKYNEAPKRYYLYESNPDYIFTIKRNLIRLDASEYAVIRPYGVWDETAEIYFNASKYGGAGGGYVTEEEQDNSIRIPVVSLDDDLGEDSHITFIKMDIEGAEQKALAGSDRIIRYNRPKLAICIYHRTVDMWQIINTLREKYDFYKHFIIRHYHNHSTGDTVLYVY